MHRDRERLPYEPSVEQKYATDPRCAGIAPWKPPSYAWGTKPNGFPLVKACRALLTADEMVGSLRVEMAKQGRQPYWVLMSDNGMAWGAHGYPLKNVPFAGQLPLYITGPGVAAGSRTA